MKFIELLNNLYDIHKNCKELGLTKKQIENLEVIEIDKLDPFGKTKKSNYFYKLAQGENDKYFLLKKEKEK